MITSQIQIFTADYKSFSLVVMKCDPKPAQRDIRTSGPPFWTRHPPVFINLCCFYEISLVWSSTFLWRQFIRLAFTLCPSAGDYMLKYWWADECVERHSLDFIIKIFPPQHEVSPNFITAHFYLFQILKLSGLFGDSDDQNKWDTLICSSLFLVQVQILVFSLMDSTSVLPLWCQQAGETLCVYRFSSSLCSDHGS